jgi:signal transduction histidine kinase
MCSDILLVDDEEGLRKVLGLSLMDRGYNIHTAGDGSQALALFEQVRPEIVLTDIKMPGMDGIDLLRAIKQRDPDTEIIMVTGHGDIDLAIKSLKFDATDFITKPIDDDILDIALKRAEERIALRRELRNYTENLERLVEEKSRQLVQAERMAAMGETVAGLAHAIKNISGGLKGGAFVVEKGLDLDNPKYLKQGWQMVRDNVSRIQQLSLDLLNIARPEAPKLQVLDPNIPLKQVCDLLRPQAEQFGISLFYRPSSALTPMALEPEGIHRCLLNLGTNALDACLQAGDCHGKRTAIIEFSSTPLDGGGVVYRVLDTCGGMEEAVQKKILQGFFTTKGSRGTGIGLMLTRKIVEAHQGRIEVSSHLGHGTTFTIYLPFRPQE